jgi:hypothetical protein
MHSPLPSFELEVLDGNDIPESWVGRQVGIETVSDPEITVGWLQSKSAWRLVVVDDRTGEARYIPWIGVEAVSLLEEEPQAQISYQRPKRAPRLDRRHHSRGVSAAYERFLGRSVVWLVGVALLALGVLALYLVGTLLVRALAGA